MNNVVYTDGSCNQSGVERNERKGRYCVVFSDGGKIIRECEAHSNNEAEYAGVIAALLDERVHDCTIFTDSMLIIGHVCLGWRCDAENLKPLYEKVRMLALQKNCRLKWISREKNIAGKEIEFVQQHTGAMFWSK